MTAAPDFTPWDRDRFKDIAWLHQAGDKVLAQTHVDSAADATTQEDADFHIDMAYLYALRATYLNTITEVND